MRTKHQAYHSPLYNMLNTELLFFFFEHLNSYQQANYRLIEIRMLFTCRQISTFVLCSLLHYKHQLYRSIFKHWKRCFQSQVGPVSRPPTTLLYDWQLFVGLLYGYEALFCTLMLQLGGSMNLVWMKLTNKLSISLSQLVLVHWWRFGEAQQLKITTYAARLA